MRKPMQKLAIACIAACAVLGGIGATNAQMHDGSQQAVVASTVVAPPTVATGFTTVATGFTTIGDPTTVASL
jgi:hypothetical protein